MAGKKDKKDLSDVEASFFGDDLDWLNDEESAEAARTSEATSDTEAAERLPVAPPPPPPYVPPSKVGKFGDAEPPPAERASRPRRAPMPTLPPTPAMLDEVAKMDAEADAPAPAPAAAPAPAPAPAPEPVVEDPPTEAADKAVAAPPSEPPAPAATRQLVVDEIDNDLPTQEDATLDVDPSSEEARRRFDLAQGASKALAAAVADDLPAERSEEVAVFGDALDDESEAEPTPLVRTHEPPPARVSTVPPPARRAGRQATGEATFTPPVAAPNAMPARPAEPAPAASAPPPPRRRRRNTANSDLEVVVPADVAKAGSETILPAPEPVVVVAPAPVVVEEEPATPTPVPQAAPAIATAPAVPLERWVPREDEDEIRDAVDVLTRAARAAAPAVAGPAFWYASRLQRQRLGDRNASESLLDDAARAGLQTADVLQDLAEAAARHQRWAQMIDHLQAKAGQLTGAGASEAFQQVAIVARQRLDQAERSVGALEKAVQADPTDYAAWCMLRDQLVELGDDERRISVLQKIAEIAPKRIAAETWWEQGRVLQRVGRVAEAQRAFERARDADPKHVPSFVALESILLGTGNETALAALYESEAQDAVSAADRGWFFRKAARLYASARQVARAEACFAQAIAAGDGVARREHEAWLARSERWKDLVAALEAEVASTEGRERAAACWRLGRARERLGDVDGAARAWREAQEADATCAIAGEAAERLLARSGRTDDLLAAAEARAAAATDEATRVRLTYRLAALAEAHGDDARAKSAWERVLAAGDDATALEGMSRLLARQGATDELSAVLERRAALATRPADRAGLLELAARGAESSGPLPGAVPGGRGPRAKELVLRALQASPDHVAALERLETLLAGEPAELAAAYHAAAESCVDPARKAQLAHRAGRLFDRSGDAARASAAADLSLEAVPGFAPALDLREDVVARAETGPERYRLERSRADASSGSARSWRLVAAAEAAASAQDARQDLLEALDLDPGHPAPLAAVEALCLGAGDLDGLLTAYRRVESQQPVARRAELLGRMAELAHDLDDHEGSRAAAQDLLTLEGAPVPVRGLARVAEAEQAWADAAALLARSDAPEDRLHRARLLVQRLQDPRQAVGLYRDLLDDPAWAVAAAHGAAGAAQRAGDRATMIRANATLAESADAPAVEAAHAVWTASLVVADDRAEDARKYWSIALGHRPSSPMAFEGAVRAHVACGDAAAVRELYAKHRPDDAVGLAEALEDAGDDQGAIAAWRTAAEREPTALYALLRLERALTRLEDWHAVYETVSRRRDLVDPAGRAAIDAKRRWLLAEKLQATDAAWDLYRQLHDEQPGDTEVTEALARIAAARGQTALSIQYLRELAEQAGSRSNDPSAHAEAARYQRRIGEVYETAGDAPSARQAYLDALDHVPDDADALSGLKRLALSSSDWPGLVAVLQREASLASGARRAEIRREIAQVTEERLGDPAVAMDAWRAVLEAAPNDEQALSRLLELAAGQKEWQSFVETGRQLSGLWKGEKRATLLRRIGVACQVELGSADAVRWFEQAVAETPPDLEAARRLEELYRTRGDWAGAVRVLQVLADGAGDTQERIGHLVAAARLEAEVRHDRKAAAALFDRVLEAEPENETALKFQAEHLFSGENTGAALPVYERLEPYMVRTQDVDDFDTRMELSSFYFRFAELLRDAGRHDEALARYKRALELNPAHLPSLEAVGPLYMKRQEWKAAEAVYRQILQLTGGQGDKDKVAALYTELGLVERALGSIDKAQKRFQKALEIQPNHVGALKGMALILEDRKDWANLLNIYNNIIYHAVSADDVIHAYMTKGRILDEQMNRPDKAAQHYDGSLQIDANQPLALLRLSELAIRRGDWAQATDFAQRGLQVKVPEKDAVRGELFLALACARKGAGDETGAKKAWADASSVTAPPGSLDDVEGLKTALRTRLPR